MTINRGAGRETRAHLGHVLGSGEQGLLRIHDVPHCHQVCVGEPAALGKLVQSNPEGGRREEEGMCDTCSVAATHLYRSSLSPSLQTWGEGDPMRLLAGTTYSTCTCTY